MVNGHLIHISTQTHTQIENIQNKLDQNLQNLQYFTNEQHQQHNGSSAATLQF